jgi:hypothetical protein
MTYPAQKYLENFYVYFLLSYRHSVKLVVINVRGLPCWDFESVFQSLIYNSLFAVCNVYYSCFNVVL